MSSRATSVCLLTAGLLTLAVELDRAPAFTLIGIAGFAGVWLVRRRLLHHQHRRSTRLHHLRRDIVTNAVVTMLLVTLASLIMAAMDVSADLLPSAGAHAAPDIQTPVAALFLLDALLAVLGLSWSILGIFGLLRRSTRRHHPSSPPAPLAGGPEKRRGAAEATPLPRTNRRAAQYRAMFRQASFTSSTCGRIASSSFGA